MAEQNNNGKIEGYREIHDWFLRHGGNNEDGRLSRNFNWADVPAFAGPVSPNFRCTTADPVGGAEYGGHARIHGSLRSSFHCHQSDFTFFHSSDWGCGCCARADDLLPTQNGW